MATNSMEDYLERIYELIQDKGYARVVDIAESLCVQEPSVTKMIQKLDEQGYVSYERYRRGLVLTADGQRLARSVIHRHRTIAAFLALLGVPEAIIAKDVEGIEHHVSQETVERIGRLVEFLSAHPELAARISRP